jgi:hypothetical protein
VVATSLTLQDFADEEIEIAVSRIPLSRRAHWRHRDLQAGRLIEVLVGEADKDEIHVHAPYRSRSRAPQRIQALLDFVIPRLHALLMVKGLVPKLSMEYSAT